MRIAKPLLVVCAALALAAPLLSEEPHMETRIGEKDFVSPPATLEQMDWLVGQWVGEGIRGAPAMESWLPPMGGTMVGTFVQETPDGEIMFTEHLYIMQEEGSLVMRLKHFNADLTGWEEKDDMLTFRLVAIEECAAYFNALTLRCADAEKPGEGLVAAVRMRSGGELLFRFERMRREFSVAACQIATSTVEIDRCLAGLLEKAEVRRAKYLAAALERENERPDLVFQIQQSEEAFRTYRDTQCGAVLEDWKEGTIRGMKFLTCKIELTDARTHTIWRNWLAYMDSTPPLLPEPKPTF